MIRQLLERLNGRLEQRESFGKSYIKAITEANAIPEFQNFEKMKSELRKGFKTCPPSRRWNFLTADIRSILFSPSSSLNRGE